MIFIFSHNYHPRAFSPLDTKHMIWESRLLTWMMSLLLITGIGFFLTFKPLSSSVLKYQEYPITLTSFTAKKAAEAYKLGVTELYMRPWGWAESDHAIYGVVSGKSTYMERASHASTRLPFLMKLKADGSVELFLHEKPQTAKDAKYIHAFIYSVLSRVVMQVEEENRDSEFRRTGKY